MPHRRTAAEFLTVADGLFRRTLPRLAPRRFLAPVAIVLAATFLASIPFSTSSARGDDLSDRTPPVAAAAGVDTAIPDTAIPNTAIPNTVIPEDVDFDPADPELSPAELSAIDEEETAAAFRPPVLPAPDADLTSADPASAGSVTAIAADRDAVSDASAVLDQADDELWFVSSRCARCEADGGVHLHYWQYAAGRWEKRTLADLQAADPTIRTCINVHGNRCDVAKANAAGWSFYSTLTGGCVNRPPIRFIIFTWPSDRICGSGRKDVQTKAVRAECHAYYLAWFVRQLSPATPLSMVGYSFGTRVIGGTLHLLGGGSLRGRSVGRADPRPGIRVVLLAAAMDNTHFLPGQAFQCGSCQIDQLLVTRNTADPAMKWYPLMYRLMLFRRRGQQSLGYTGLAGLNCLPCLYGRVEHRDVTCAVGKVHDWSGCAYLMPNLSERMRQYIYHEPVRSTPAPSFYAVTATAPSPAAWALLANRSVTTDP
jgi:hypothetical protein